MRVYQYRCNDYSLLTPVFKKVVVAPLLRFVPWALTANFITLIANLFVYFGLLLSLNPVFGVYNNLLIALCLIIYLIGDHLDGMQAKRTGTGSALGEFFDHYLDAFNNGIILFTMFTVFGITNPFVIGGVIAISYLAHLSIFYEQFKTGWLTFEKMGSLEGVLFAAGIIALASADSVTEVLLQEVAYSFTVFEFVMMGSALGALLTFITTVIRTPGIKSSFWVFCVSLIVITGLSVNLFTPFQLSVILTLYASLYIGRIMRGHLVDGVERTTDSPTLLYVLLLTFYEFLPDPYSFIILTAYLAIHILILIIQTFSSLKIYWMWKNPLR